MSSVKEFASVLDIGSKETRVFIGRRTAKGVIEVVGVGSAETRGVRNGVVVNVKEAGESVLKAVESVEKKVDLKVKQLSAGVSGYKVKTSVTEGYRIIKDGRYVEQSLIDDLSDEAYRISQRAGEEVYGVYPWKFIVDGVDNGARQPVGMVGKRIDVKFKVISFPELYRLNLKQCVEVNGLKLGDVYLNPCVQDLAFLTNEDKEAGVVLIDMGAGTTEVSIYHDGVLQDMSVLPFGGDAITYDIKEGCNVSYVRAELAKTRCGYAMQSLAPDNEYISFADRETAQRSREISYKNLSCVVQARMEEIAGGVGYIIERSGFGNRLGAGVVLVGGGAGLRGVCELISYVVRLDVRLGKPVLPVEKHLFNNHDLNYTLANSMGLLVADLDRRAKRRGLKSMVHKSGVIARQKHGQSKQADSDVMKGIQSTGKSIMSAGKSFMGSLFSSLDQFTEEDDEVL